MLMAITCRRFVSLSSVRINAASVCSVIAPNILFLTAPTRIAANCVARVAMTWRILCGRHHHGLRLWWARARRVEALIIFSRIGCERAWITLAQRCEGFIGCGRCVEEPKAQAEPVAPILLAGELVELELFES